MGITEIRNQLKTGISRDYTWTALQRGYTDKILYINDLFNGDDQQYRLSIQRINEMSSFDEVLDYTRNAFPDWDEDSQATYRFYMNVRRKVNG